MPLYIIDVALDNGSVQGFIAPCIWEAATSRAAAETRVNHLAWNDSNRSGIVRVVEVPLHEGWATARHYWRWELRRDGMANRTDHLEGAGSEVGRNGLDRAEPADVRTASVRPGVELPYWVRGEPVWQTVHGYMDGELVIFNGRGHAADDGAMAHVDFSIQGGRYARDGSSYLPVRWVRNGRDRNQTDGGYRPLDFRSACPRR